MDQFTNTLQVLVIHSSSVVGMGTYVARLILMKHSLALHVMESLEHANKRGAKIIAEYLGGAITCDAHHPTEPRSDGLGISACITKSLLNGGVSPEEVNYINAHATSTIKGDLAEINAIKKVFKDTSGIKMNGTKSMIGHAIAAAAGLEAIATIRAITTGWLHPTINQYNLEPEVTIDTIPNTKIKYDVNVGKRRIEEKGVASHSRSILKTVQSVTGNSL